MTWNLAALLHCDVPLQTLTPLTNQNTSVLVYYNDLLTYKYGCTKYSVRTVYMNTVLVLLFDLLTQ